MVNGKSEDENIFIKTGKNPPESLAQGDKLPGSLLLRLIYFLTASIEAFPIEQQKSPNIYTRHTPGIFYYNNSNLTPAQPGRILPLNITGSLI